MTKKELKELKEKAYECGRRCAEEVLKIQNEAILYSIKSKAIELDTKIVNNPKPHMIQELKINTIREIGGDCSVGGVRRCHVVMDNEGNVMEVYGDASQLYYKYHPILKLHPIEVTKEQYLKALKWKSPLYK